MPARHPNRWLLMVLVVLCKTAWFAGVCHGGLLFFASYPARDNTAPVANPHIQGALLTIYWSRVEPKSGQYDWGEMDRRIKPWIDGGKKIALRIMWSSSGRWPEPAAKHPTPPWVIDEGAVVVVAEQSQTQVPLVWDPIYKKYADRFLREVARKFDGNPHLLFVDVTPGAETNPYRGRMDLSEPDFRERFLRAPASDGRKYSDALWLETVKQYVDTASGAFRKSRLLVTLNVGSLEGPTQFHQIGSYCVDKGCLVGQNGLTGKSYLEDSPRRRDFLQWGPRTGLYFEMNAATGSRTGSLMEVMKAAQRIRCDYLGVYAVDVLRGTLGQDTYDAAYAEALAYGAKVIGNRPPENAAPKVPPVESPLPAADRKLIRGN